MELFEKNPIRQNFLETIPVNPNQRYLDAGKDIVKKRVAGYLHPEILTKELTDKDYIEIGRGEGEESNSDFTTGLKRGVQQTQALFYGGAGLAGSAMAKAGMEDTGEAVKDWGMRGYRRNMAEAEKYPAKHSFKDVYTGEAGIGGTVDWAQGVLGELAPTMASAAMGTGVATLAGKTILKKAVANAVKKGIEKGVKDKAGRLLTSKAIENQVMKKIAHSGMYATVGTMEAGGMYGEVLEEHGVDAPFTALAFGALAARLETIGGNSRLIDLFIDGVAKGKVKSLKGIAKSILKQSSEEALQETGQEVFAILNTVINTDEKLLTPKNLERILESAAAGAVGGGAGGTFAGAVSATKNETPAVDDDARLEELREQADESQLVEYGEAVNKKIIALERIKNPASKEQAELASYKAELEQITAQIKANEQARVEREATAQGSTIQNESEQWDSFLYDSITDQTEQEMKAAGTEMEETFRKAKSELPDIQGKTKEELLAEYEEAKNKEILKAREKDSEKILDEIEGRNRPAQETVERPTKIKTLSQAEKTQRQANFDKIAAELGDTVEVEPETNIQTIEKETPRGLPGAKIATDNGKGFSLDEAEEKVEILQSEGIEAETVELKNGGYGYRLIADESEQWDSFLDEAIETKATQDKQVANVFKETDTTENKKRFEENPLDAENNNDFLDKFIEQGVQIHFPEVKIDPNIEPLRKAFEEGDSSITPDTLIADSNAKQDVAAQENIDNISDFREEAAKEGHAAQASDIRYGDNSQLLHDIEKGYIDQDAAIELYKDAVTRGIAGKEKFNAFISMLNKGNPSQKETTSEPVKDFASLPLEEKIKAQTQKHGHFVLPQTGLKEFSLKEIKSLNKDKLISNITLNKEISRRKKQESKTDTQIPFEAMSAKELADHYMTYGNVEQAVKMLKYDMAGHKNSERFESVKTSPKYQEAIDVLEKQQQSVSLKPEKQIDITEIGDPEIKTKEQRPQNNIWEAYKKASAKSGFKNVAISEILKNSNLSLKELHESLLKESKKGNAILAFGDWSLSNKEERSATIDINGRHHLLVRIKKPFEITKKEQGKVKANDLVAPANSSTFQVLPDELDYQTAYDAHRGSSHTPEQRAKQEQQGFVRHMEDIKETLLKGIDQVRPEDKSGLMSVLDGVLRRYKDGYLKKYTAYLNAMSKTMSPMIAGHSNFPAAKNQKALDRERKVSQELTDWEKRALKNAKKELGLIKQPILSDDPLAIEKLQDKLSKLEATHQQMKDINKIVRNKKLSDEDKIKAMTDMGISDATVKQALEPDYSGRLGIPGYALTNNNANMKSIQKRIEDLQSKSTDETTDETTELEFDSGIVVDNVEDNRVQIIYDDKPDNDIISSLKKRGFRWAPSTGAWQRKRTKVALHDAQEITGAKVKTEHASVEETKPKSIRKGIQGKKDTTYLNDNTPIKFQYEVLELSDVIPSHNVSGTPNPNFDSDLQPRDRSRKAMILQTDSMANKLNPEKLGSNPSIAHGAPMISSNSNMVEAGHGRTQAITKAYNGKKGAEYKAWLNANASEFGITDFKIKDMRQPILVRRRITQIDNIKDITEKSNEPETAKMSTTEQAIIDAGNLSKDDMSTFRPDGDGNINASSNQTFINRFLDKMGASEKPGYVTSEGKANKQLIDRIQAAIFHKAYGADELLTMVVEEADPDIKNILNGLTKSASSFAKAKGLNEGLAGLTIVNDVIEGINLLRKAKAENRDVKAGNGNSAIVNQLNQALSQRDMFDSGQSEAVIEIAKIIAQNIRSGKRIGEFIDNIGVSLKTYLADLSQMEMFGTKQEISTLNLIAQSKEILEDKYEEKQLDIFGQKPDTGTKEKGKSSHFGRGFQKSEPGAHPERTETGKAEKGKEEVSEKIDLFNSESKEKELINDKKPIQGDLFTGMPSTQVQGDLFAAELRGMEGKENKKNKKRAIRSVETGLRDSGYIKSHGLTAKSSHDVASLFRFLAKDPQESLFLLSTDSNGKILNIHDYSRGGKGSSIAIAPEMVGKMLSDGQTARVFFVHQHPGGSTESSAGDREIYLKVKKILDLKGIDTRGIIIGKDANKTPVFSEFEEYGNVSEEQIVKKIKPDSEIKIVKRTLIKDKPTQRALSSEAMEGFLKDKNTGFAFLDGRGNINGYYEFMPGESFKEVMAQIVQEAERTNSHAAILYNADPSKQDTRLKDFRQIASVLGQVSVPVHDVMQKLKTGEIISSREMGYSFNDDSNASWNDTATDKPLYQIVYHGGPNQWQSEPNFPNGRPRLDKIGTGEGNQAYGWGWYSADNKEVGTAYKEELTKDQGVLYKLDIPDKVLPHLLDWDKQLSEKKMIDLYDKLQKTGLHSFATAFQESWYKRQEKGKNNWDGQDFYTELTKEIGSDKATSEYLASIGVPGNKYLDGSSRNVPSQNVVDIRHLKKTIDQKQKEITDLQKEVSQNKNNKGLTSRFFESRISNISLLQNEITDYKKRINSLQKGKNLSYNYVIWDQKILDQVALLARNNETIKAIQFTLQNQKKDTEVTPLDKLITAQQVKKWFKSKDQTTGIDKDGNVFVRTQNGLGIQINLVKKISDKDYEIAFNTGQMDKKGNIAGKVEENTITLSTDYASDKTLPHEVIHLLENAGVINQKDINVLDTKIHALNKHNKLGFEFQTDKRENRANFFAQYLADREQFRGTRVGEILQKIADFLDALIHVGRSSTRKLATSIESGKIFKKGFTDIKNSNPQYMFAGESANTADQTSFNKAVSMMMEAPADTNSKAFEIANIKIWKKTGWILGQDNKWRFEIDDSKAEWRNPWQNIKSGDKGNRDFGQKGVYRLGDILKHDLLFKSYPELKDFKLLKTKLLVQSLGSFNPTTKQIWINPKLSPQEAMGTTLHEIQHWVQFKEGFAVGGGLAFSNLAKGVPKIKSHYLKQLKNKKLDPLVKTKIDKILYQVAAYEDEKPNIDKAIKEIDDLTEKFDMYRKKIYQKEKELLGLLNKNKTDEKLKILKKKIKTLRELNIQASIHYDTRKQQMSKQVEILTGGFNALQYQAYRLIAGEIEARDVTARKDLPPGERAKIIPFTSQGIDREDATVLFKNNNNNQTQYSVAPQDVFDIPDNSTKIENLKYQIIRELSPIDKIYKAIGKDIPEDIDFRLKEELRTSQAKNQIEQAEAKYHEPIKKLIGENNLTVADVDEFVYARTVPESNARLRLTNARHTLNQLANAQKGNELKKFIDKIDAKFELEQMPTHEIQEAYLNTLEDELDNADTEAELAVKARWEIFSSKPTGMTDGLGYNAPENAENEAKTLMDKWAGNQAMKDIAKLFDAMNQESLKISYEAGRMTKEEYDAIRGTFEYYAPLKREGFETKQAGTGRGVTNLGRDVGVRGGSTKRAVHLLANALVSHEKNIIRAHKAAVAKAFVGFVKANPNENFWWFEKAKTKAAYDGRGNIKRVASRDVDDGPGGKEVQLKVDGELYIIGVRDQNTHAMRLLDIIRGNENSHGPIVDALSKFNRFLAMINTSLSPEFILTNPIRDVQTAFFNLSDTDAANMKKRIFKNIPKAMAGLRSIFRGDSTHEWAEKARQYKAAGAQVGWMGYDKAIGTRVKKLESQIDMFREGHIGKKNITKLFKAIEDYNSIAENAVRLSAFEAGIKAGMTVPKAALMAKGLTVNFSQKGHSGQIINSLYLFANAGIQGSTRLITAIYKSPKVRKLVGMSMLAAFGMAMANRGIGGKDDDGEDYYDQIDHYIKSRNMIFMIPGGKGEYVKIPLPWGYNVFWALGTEVGDAFSGKNYDPLEGMSRMLTTAMDSFNPLQSATMLQMVSPTITDPFAQIGENKTFFGSPLMPEKNIFAKFKTPDSERYWSSARTSSKFIAKEINKLFYGDSVHSSGLPDISPETLDLVLDTFTGGAGRFFYDTFHLPYNIAVGKSQLTKTPIIRRFIGAKSEYKVSSDYRNNTAHIYELIERMKTYPEKAKKLQRDKTYLLYKRVKKTDSKIRSLNKMKKRSKDDTVVERIDDKIKLYKKQFNQMFSKIKRG